MAPCLMKICVHQTAAPQPPDFVQATSLCAVGDASTTTVARPWSPRLPNDVWTAPAKLCLVHVAGQAMVSVVDRCAHEFPVPQSHALPAPDLPFFACLFHSPLCRPGLLRSVQGAETKCLRPLSCLSSPIVSGTILGCFLPFGGCSTW